MPRKTRKDDRRKIHPNSLANLAPHAPPFEKGTQAARTHGARAATVPAVVMRPKVAAVYDALAASVPVRGDDGEVHHADRHGVHRLAEVLCRLDMIADYLAEHGVVNKKGEAHSLLRHEARYEREARAWMDALGLTPQSRVDLLNTTAQTEDLAQRWARDDERDRERRRARRQRSADVDTDAEEVE